MKLQRRDFLAGTLATAAVAGVREVGAENPPVREFYEVREVHLENDTKQQRLLEFMETAYLPAANRAGVSPIGVFTSYSGEDFHVRVLTPFSSLEQMVSLKSKLLGDREFQEKGSDFLNAPASDPAYVRMESSLLLAFSHLPRLETPEKKAGRLYELRTYESHSVLYGQRKIHMFNEGGEIEIFRKTGLQPVFFGEALVGSRLPNLTYMITFEDMEAHDKNWKTFIDHPEWKKLNGNPYYKDTVSNITKVFLKAADCSQI